MGPMEQKVFDISGRCNAQFHVKLNNTHSTLIPGRIFCHRLTEDFSQSYKQFPEYSHGFLYYHCDATLPPLAGEIRFRICKSLARFNQGYDLQFGFGQFWSVSLIRIISSGAWIGIRDLLVQDGLLDRGLMTRVLEHAIPLKAHDRQFLYHIDQPLIVHLQRQTLKVHLLTPDFHATILLEDLFSPHRSPVYTGVAQVRFELSTLPEHKDLPTLVLRLLKVLSPLQPAVENPESLFPMPKEGELFQRFTRSGRPRPWSYPLGSSKINSEAWRRFLGLETDPSSAPHG